MPKDYDVSIDSLLARVSFVYAQRYNKPRGEQNKFFYFLSRGAVYLQAAQQIKVKAERITK